MCDSCYEEHGPKGSSSATQGGSSSSGESSPVKSSRGGSGGNRRGHHRNPMGSADVGAMDSDLPAEYLSSPLSKEASRISVIHVQGDQDALLLNFKKVLVPTCLTYRGFLPLNSSSLYAVT